MTFLYGGKDTQSNRDLGGFVAGFEVFRAEEEIFWGNVIRSNSDLGPGLMVLAVEGFCSDA